MIGLDSNVFVRYFLHDDPAWTEAAIKCIDEDCTPERPGHVNIIVLTEVVWALQYAPGYDRSKLAKIIDGFLEADNLIVAEETAVGEALEMFKEGNADFADYLILTLNQGVGAAPTMTLDQTAAREPGFQHLSRRSAIG